MKLFKQRRIFLIFLCGFCMGACGGSGFEDSSETDIASQIEALVIPTLMDNGPGVAVGVIKDEVVLFAQGYGLANLELGVPITVDSVFDLASVSKQLTGMAILILAEQGDVDVQAPIATYVNDFVDVYPERPVTILDLLHHVSGLVDYSSEWDETDAAFAELTLEDFLIWLNAHPANDEPGEVYEYNNSGYALLALLVQRVTEQPFAQWMQNEVFTPLDMSQTMVMDDFEESVPGVVSGYRVNEGVAVPEINRVSMSGDGNVFSSLSDWIKLDQAWRQNSLVTSESKQQAFSAGLLETGDPIEDEGLGYGFGWEVGDGFVSHSGGWDGTSTYYYHGTNQSLSVIILANDSEYDAEALALQIIELIRN